MEAQALGNCIKEIRKDSGISALNEEDAKRRIILRILSLLGWDIYSSEIKQEHGVGVRRVDYALQVSGENRVFIEAPKPRSRPKDPASPNGYKLMMCIMS